MLEATRKVIQNENANNESVLSKLKNIHHKNFQMQNDKMKDISNANNTVNF